MNRNQIIAVLVAIAATVGIYFGTTNVKPKQHVAAHGEGDGHNHDADASAVMLEAPKAANFDSLLAATKKRLLNPQSMAEINGLETEAITTTDKALQSQKYQTLGQRWQKMNQYGIAAHYYQEAGSLENSEKLMTFAAHLFSEALAEEENINVRQWMAESRLSILNQLIAANPDNDSLQIDAAIAMIDKGDVMNGVFRLRDFSDKNPDNIRAQITLGKMAVQSNQLDKAIERGSKVLSLDKDNIEARLFMGEAYKEKGNTDKAIDLFTEAKNLMNNPEFSKEIDGYIATFKKQEP